MYIKFSDLPGHQNLFLDYLYEFENVKEFYKNNFRDKEEYLKKFKQISESRKDFNEELPAIIEGQYDGFVSSEKTKKNISYLKDKKTLAIVTGQQLGILGGPLYTFYKIITAIKLSVYLAERYNEFNFVPVFWLEGDDHDFDEISHVNLINENNDIVKINYRETTEDDENSGSVGNLKIDNLINAFFDSLSSELRESEFKDELLAKLKSFYSEGKTFKQSFKELIFWLFDERGLVIFDPQDKKVKKLLRPIFKKEIDDFRQHTEKLVHVSAKLEEVYHAQVKINPINLFFNNQDGRYAIEPADNEFRLKRKRKKFSYDEIIELIENEPELFSANVLLRPICQDFIFPTAFYVAGPSEITYFAQVLPLYNFYNLESPIIYPRSSVTILEKNIKSLVEKFDLNLHDIFIDNENLKEKVLKSILKTSLDDAFKNTSNDIDVAIDQLKERLFEIDKTLTDAASKYREKILKYIDELKGKANEAQKRKYETTLRQIDKISTSVYPNNSLQERELNFTYFANKYGNNFLKQIYEELEINKFEHQTINF
jgi:bacillithiol synthase